MLTWASGDARRVAQRLQRANNVSITDITTALATALRTAGQKTDEEYDPRLDAIFKDHIMALSATSTWRYAVVSDSDTTPETQPIGMDPSQIDGGQLLNLFSSEEAIPAALLPCATKEGGLHYIFLELIPSMSLLACKLNGVPEANAVRVVAMDPVLVMTDEQIPPFPLLFDGVFPLIQEIMYKNAHEFYLIQLRDQITTSGVAEISSEQWAQVCMVGGTGDPELSAGGLCSVKIDGVEGSDDFLLHLDGDEQGNGMKVVMCVQPCDAQRLIDVGLADTPELQARASVATLTAQQSKEVIEALLDDAREPRCAGVRVMTTMTLAQDENARGMQRLFMNELLLTPAMYADPESQMKAGFDAVYDRATTGTAAPPS